MSEPWTLERLQALAEPWLQPVSADRPGGVSAKTDKSYEKVLSEVSKLESPSGGAVDWKAVTAESQALLVTKSKDLLLSAYLAFALVKLRGLKGLLQGLAVIHGILVTYWASAYPEVARLRGRANALDWLVSRLPVPLSELPVTAQDRETVEGLNFVGALLQEQNRAHFGAQAPALGPLVEALERLAAALPPEVAVLPTPPTPPPVPEGVALREAPPVAAAPPVEIGPHLLLPASGAGVEDQLAFLGEVGEALVDVAASLRAASLEDPLGYRLLRAALWLPLVRAPTADTDGKTGLDPLPEDLRGELERAEANQAWHELLRACEQALPRHPLALWLQRLAATALAGLQLVEARHAVEVEVRALLGRLPQLTALRYSDGSPLADEATRDWLVSNELLRPDSARPRPAPASAAEAPLEPPLALAQRALSLGARKEAMAQAALALKGATSDRERFLARLAQAQACALGGDPALAPALFQKLDAEVLAKGLELWEPLLAAQVLKGILGLGRPSVDTPQTWWGDYLSRLFLIDPQGALELKAPKDRGSA